MICVHSIVHVLQSIVHIIHIIHVHVLHQNIIQTKLFKHYFLDFIFKSGKAFFCISCILFAFDWIWIAKTGLSKIQFSVWNCIQIFDILLHTSTACVSFERHDIVRHVSHFLTLLCLSLSLSRYLLVLSLSYSKAQ